MRTCLCCQTETSRPDQRTATAGLHSLMHVDTGHLSSTTTGMSTSLSKQGHGMLCHCQQPKLARRRDVHRHLQNQPNHAAAEERGHEDLAAGLPTSKGNTARTASNQQNQKCTCPCQCRRRAVSISKHNCPSSHTHRPDEHHGPDDKKREHSARSVVTSETHELQNCPSGPYRA